MIETFYPLNPLNEPFLYNTAYISIAGMIRKSICVFLSIC